MSKKNILASVRKMTEDILKTTDMELIDLEYVKEGPFKYLRIYIDKPGGVNVDDTADVSRILSKKLDEADLIKDQYFLEVSSPGVERPFKREEDFQNNIGNVVEAKFYKPVDGKKSLLGVLKEKKDNNIVIEAQDKTYEIELEDISKINRVIEDF
ncbi:MAG: ribosome maturation factor RimP [Bacillota bacterium]|jgi:ribosome maturation factor RimP|nr:ribosome maturation factor RimP [Bacillota bacterium]NLL60422.1 ribosome maturation factor RimP [Tissierellia bacterium]